MTNAQMFVAILLPTVTAIVGIYVNTGRFGSIDARLIRIEAELSETRQRLAHLEGSLGGK
jgi:hypothetical protein